MANAGEPQYFFVSNMFELDLLYYINKALVSLYGRDRKRLFLNTTRRHIALLNHLNIIEGVKKRGALVLNKSFA